MNDHIEVNYKSGDIEEFHKELINRSLCGLFLPGNVLECQGATIITYSTKDYLPVTAVEALDVCRALDMISCLMAAMMEAERRYFFLGEYSMEPEHIYVSMEGSQVCLIYRKAEYADEKQVYEKLIDLIEILKTKLVNGGESYLDTAAGYLRRGKSSPGVVRHRIEELSREARACRFE
ncbi:hypothetical protein [Aminicella lysinilytica]|uniref:Uncharacterized protein n=1 Tax=Aminicella lysinilytica TaxID=433323 RepID=A0A4R6Q5F3_9FIRM|nr:hypothetical protein [Aminicella lysinilytica]TDP57471.1 hypothetical protein EV211_11221 [Aminicella lysinilytica]